MGIEPKEINGDEKKKEGRGGEEGRKGVFSAISVRDAMRNPQFQIDLIFDISDVKTSSGQSNFSYTPENFRTVRSTI